MGFSVIPWITLGGASEVGILINLLTSDFPLTMHSSRSLSIEFQVMRCKEKRKGKKISLFRSFLGFVAKVFMELQLKKPFYVLCSHIILRQETPLKATTVKSLTFWSFSCTCYAVGCIRQNIPY